MRRGIIRRNQRYQKRHGQSGRPRGRTDNLHADKRYDFAGVAGIFTGAASAHESHAAVSVRMTA